MRVCRIAMFVLLAFAAVLAAACGGGNGKKETRAGGSTPTGAPTAPISVSPSNSITRPAATSAAGSPTPAVSPVALRPSIQDALSCRVPAKGDAGANGVSTAALQRQDIDTKVFPNAVCNDGSPAVLYFRPYDGEANRDKWVIALAGGGDCSDPQGCADRWCGVGTNFDSDNMSSDYAGNGRPTEGIFACTDANPFANWNQVFVKYCTSDVWTGEALGLSLDAKDPKSGAPVNFMISFAGAYAFDAAITTLRKDGGAPPLTYVRTKTQMSDLDNASEVVLAGGSAGGAGVIYNLDRLAALLQDAPKKPVVRGLIDSVTGPTLANLGYESSTACANGGACTYEALFKAAAARNETVLHKLTDDSCLDWHRKNAPGTEWKCFDQTHVLQNHVTTPFFVRMGLADQQISSNYIGAGYSYQGKVLTTLTFATLDHEMLSGLQQAVMNGEEKSAMTKPPGIFAPSCNNHYTIFEDDTTYNVSIPVGGKQVTLMDTWNNWIGGKSPDVVISSDPKTDHCK